MSEKQQKTSAHLREQMLGRYSDGLSHKHNKYHNDHRHHFRSHPKHLADLLNSESPEDRSTGLIRKFKLRKLRKRLDKGRIH